MRAKEIVLLPDGKTFINQSSNGQSVSSDTAFLVQLLSENFSSSVRNVLDIGCGNGIISIMLVSNFPNVNIIGIDIQPDLIDLAIKNSENCNQQIDFLVEDLRRFDRKKQFDLVVANPPYFEVGSGRMGPDKERNRSRFELDCTLPEVVQCISRNLHSMGTGYIMYPENRENQMYQSCRDYHLKISEKWNIPENRKRKTNIYKVEWENNATAT